MQRAANLSLRPLAIARIGFLKRARVEGDNRVQALFVLAMRSRYCWTMRARSCGVAAWPTAYRRKWPRRQRTPAVVVLTWAKRLRR